VSIVRTEHRVDVTSALPAAVRGRGPVDIAVTVVADPARVSPSPDVVVAIPGGTYHRRYWDLQPPGRRGYSKAAWLAARGVVVVATDYLGGGDSTRPDDGDFMTLEVAADAGHAVLEDVRSRASTGTLVDGLPAVESPRYVGVGQSLGGHITMIQQGKYRDYSAVGLCGVSPTVIANIPEHAASYEGLDADERRSAIMAENARTSGLVELPMYHGAPREHFRGIFHTLDVPDDLVRYDEDQCHTLISRVSGVDGMTPGISRPFAERICDPVFLAFGDSDVSADPRGEPAAFAAARDITLVVVPHMAHMHNFADTREQLWERFHHWLEGGRS